MQTRAQKDCFGECSLFYTFLNYVVLFYNQHILFDNWKKTKDYIKKKKVKRKYFWRKEIKTVARRASLPTTPQRSVVGQLSTNKSSGRGPCRRFQQHSGIKKTKYYIHTGREGRLPHFVCIIPFSKPALFSARRQLPLNRKGRAKWAVSLQSFLPYLYDQGEALIV